MSTITEFGHNKRNRQKLDKQDTGWLPTKIRFVLLMILLLLTASGCSAKPQTQQASLTGEITLDAENTVGQTFVARFDGLSGIYFHLSPVEAGNGEIVLHLRNDSQSTQDLATSYNPVTISTIQGDGIYGFFVPALGDSNQAYYYAFLEVIGDGRVEVGFGPGDSYFDGALYQNHEPLDSQSVFQLSYSRKLAALGLAREFLTWGWILILSCLIYILPGWGLLSILLPMWNGLRWPEKLGLSAGTSLAIYPVLFLWTDLFGLHLYAAYAWIPPLVGIILLTWKNWGKIKFSAKHPHVMDWHTLRKRTFHREYFLPDLTLLALVGMVVFTRFWAIRSLEAPLWGDGYQHSMIIQLMIDHGGLFTSWQPYAELTTFTYHYGFHSAVTVFHWVSGIDAIHATLWIGQVLNVLAILVLYPLATKVGKNTWAGVIAVLVAGLLSPMPMFYVNWGRYTQLAGQVILPIVIWLAWEIMVDNKLRWPTLAASWLLWAGLALTHYRVLIMGVLFIPAFWIISIRRNNWQQILKATLAMGVGGGLLFLPWFVRVFGGKILLALGIQLTTPAGATSAAIIEYNVFGNISTYLPITIWLATILCFIWGIWRRNKSIIIIVLWWFLLFVSANPNRFYLPGAGAINNFAILIATYIFASILIAIVVGKYLTKIKSAWYSAFLAILLTILGGIISINRVQANNLSAFVLLSRPDKHAAYWVREYIPLGSRILINSFPAFSGTSVVGSDGGWWLPLLTKRLTTLPPLLYVAEQGPNPNYIEEVNDFHKKMNQTTDAAEISKMLQESGIDYVYLGEKQGNVNNPTLIHIRPETLLSSNEFRNIYHKDRVWVFALVKEK